MPEFQSNGYGSGLTSRVREPDNDGFLHVDAEPLLHGHVRIEQAASGWFRPLRFTAQQARALSSVRAWRPGLYRQMATTSSGVTVEFETDAASIALEVRLDPELSGTADQLALAPGAPPDGVSADIDGEHVSPVVPDGMLDRVVFDLGYRATSPYSSHRVRVWLPWGSGVTIRDVIVDGTVVRTVPDRERILVLSDSIAQGFVVGDPAFSWPSLLAASLGYDVLNQGVGGQIFQASALADVSALPKPSAVIVSLGVNYAYAPFAPDVVERDATQFFDALARGFEGVPVFVATPYWFSPEVPLHPRSSIAEVPGIIERQVAAHEGFVLVDGLDLMDHDAELLADGEAHPNAHGAAQIADAWAEVLAEHLALPESDEYDGFDDLDDDDDDDDDGYVEVDAASRERFSSRSFATGEFGDADDGDEDDGYENEEDSYDGVDYEGEYDASDDEDEEGGSEDGASDDTGEDDDPGEFGDDVPEMGGDDPNDAAELAGADGLPAVSAAPEPAVAVGVLAKDEPVTTEGGGSTEVAPALEVAEPEPEPDLEPELEAESEPERGEEPEEAAGDEPGEGLVGQPAAERPLVSAAEPPAAPESELPPDPAPFEEPSIPMEPSRIDAMLRSRRDGIQMEPLVDEAPEERPIARATSAIRTILFGGLTVDDLDEQEEPEEAGESAEPEEPAEVEEAVEPEVEEPIEPEGEAPVEPEAIEDEPEQISLF